MQLLKKSLKIGCVPVSAVVVRDGKIVSSGYNRKEKTNNPLDHAEIIAIRRAVKKLSTWKLNDCELYVTMKPCKMCETVISECRIAVVHYIVENKKEAEKSVPLAYKESGIGPLTKEYQRVLKTFFKRLRNGEK